MFTDGLTKGLIPINPISGKGGGVIPHLTILEMEVMDLICGDDPDQDNSICSSADVDQQIRRP